MSSFSRIVILNMAAMVFVYNLPIARCQSLSPINQDKDYVRFVYQSIAADRYKLHSGVYASECDLQDRVIATSVTFSGDNVASSGTIRSKDGRRDSRFIFIANGESIYYWDSDDETLGYYPKSKFSGYEKIHYYPVRSIGLLYLLNRDTGYFTDFKRLCNVLQDRTISAFQSLDKTNDRVHVKSATSLPGQAKGVHDLVLSRDDGMRVIRNHAYIKSDVNDSQKHTYDYRVEWLKLNGVHVPIHVCQGQPETVEPVFDLRLSWSAVNDATIVPKCSTADIVIPDGHAIVDYTVHPPNVLRPPARPNPARELRPTSRPRPEYVTLIVLIAANIAVIGGFVAAARLYRRRSNRSSG